MRTGKSFMPRVKRGVMFSKARQSSAKTSPSSSSMADEDTATETRLVELPDSDTETPGLVASVAAGPTVPPLYTSAPPLRDALATETSRAQNETATECVRCLEGEGGELSGRGVPRLQRARHARFLRQTVAALPSWFVALDASRPWIIYWATAGLSMLGEGFDDAYRRDVAGTFAAFQHGDGGFGGGPGQCAHLACSYAAVLCLVAVGGADALELVDRAAMWRWLGRMKQADGGFRMCEGGEEDVRGAFCAMVIASLLRLPLEMAGAEVERTGRDRLDGGLAEWVGRCQGVEGGIAAAPGNEAHGAYAFCALACLCILAAPGEGIARHIDTGALFGWLAHRQHAPEGGFAGRTNKLVDGCYSHWIGGCWALLEAATGQEGGLWEREGLTRYILCCAQEPGAGGLRDKPGKAPDGYHTCYNLAGLGWAQYRHVWSPDGLHGDDAPLSAAFGWRLGGVVEGLPVEPADRVTPMHPIFVIPACRAVEARRYFGAKAGF